MNGFENWILTSTIFSPAVGAIAVACCPRRERVIEGVALAAGVVSLVLACVVVGMFLQA